MYIKFLPNEYVLRYRKGKQIDSGAGLSFYYYDKSTAAAVVPISGMDADFIFEETTADFQKVTVQGQMTYRVTDYEKIASMMNFTVNLRTKGYYDEPLKKLSKRMINIADVLVKACIAEAPLTKAIKAEREFAVKIFDELREAKEVALMGIEVMGFSILRISAANETHRALEAGTREEILKKSDDALYERRNASIEQERKVKENELNTEISIEEKKKQIKETELDTRRMLLEKEAELQRIEIAAETEKERERTAADTQRQRMKIEAQTENDRLRTAAEAERERMKIDAEIEIERKRKELADMKLENAKKAADAEAYRLAAIMDVYAKLDTEVLVALAALNMEPEKMIAGAFEKLAANSEKIGTLNITPDLLETLRTVH